MPKPLGMSIKICFGVGGDYICGTKQNSADPPPGPTPKYKTEQLMIRTIESDSVSDVHS